MTYAKPDDVAALWGRTLTDEETTLVQRRLGQVERLIHKRIPDLDAKIAADVIDVDDVIQVEADAVLRVVRNPDGVIEETDGNYTYRRGYDADAGKLMIYPDEWETLGIRQSRVSLLVPSVGW
ncbi:phage Gp19/Gp15/Gp42 family protein [Mycolicibacterium goodii]|uniref:Gp19/Gp15/Gp42 family protein n=1 Tax=Mycolicibacterium goodii TaxID=134601 RepID=UPI001BDCB65E|nr:Gp19/Gp15/Gp42 family protein [Mycolicibacterium goodii]MBU8808072.1 phage Gp19/Gp15/Gp42 family protein [Mycolicibacterium goodii]